MRIRSAPLYAALAAAVAVPPAAGAQAVSLSPDRPCYAPGQVISLTGYGFTPSGDVSLSAGGQQLGLGGADSDGVFSARVRMPALGIAEGSLTFTATDQTYLLNAASAAVRLTALSVRITPTTGTPGRRRLIRARGFTDGLTLYAHVRRARTRGARNVRIGALTGACGKLSVRRRLFSPNVRTGTYTVQFDSNRRYFPASAPSVTYVVHIAAAATRARGATASAATTGERWSGPIR